MKRMKLLIVEDDLDLLGLVDFNLTRKGYATAGVYNGNLAISVFEEFKPDLVVLDLMLPGIDGWEICRRIREKDTETIIIMLTAKGSPEDRVRGFEIGGDDYMTKPFEVKELLSRIERLLERRRQVRSTQDMQRMLVHEVNNRMTVIGGYAQAIDKRYASSAYDDKTKYLESIKRESKMAGAFVSDLGSLFDIESGKIKIKQEQIILKRLIYDIGTTFMNFAEDLGVNVNFTIDDDLPEVKADYMALRQVLSNLMSNAIKFNKRGGSVNISASGGQDVTIISVKDNGYGIKKEDLGLIFDKFYRCGNRAVNKNGSGLGLYIVKKLTDAMGIGIEARSDPAGSSEFILSIKSVM